MTILDYFIRKLETLPMIILAYASLLNCPHKINNAYYAAFTWIDFLLFHQCLSYQSFFCDSLILKNS